MKGAISLIPNFGKSHDDFGRLTSPHVTQQQHGGTCFGQLVSVLAGYEGVCGPDSTSHLCCEIHLKSSSFVIRKHEPFSVCWGGDSVTRVSSELRSLHLSTAAGIKGRL